MTKIIKVGMADLNVAVYPDRLTTLALGSCVGVNFYDTVTNNIGMAHIMLPSCSSSMKVTNIAKYADTGIVKLLNDMLLMGSLRRNIIAKIAGGAQMFALSSGSDIMNIGKRNVAAVKQKLYQLKIPIVSEDTGGNYARTIVLFSEKGDLKIKTIGHGIKII